MAEFHTRTVFHELDRLILTPSILVCGIAITVHVRGSTASNRPWLPEDTASKRNIVHTRAILLVPPGNNDSCTQRILVLVADILEQRGGSVGRWLSTHVLSTDIHRV